MKKILKKPLYSIIDKMAGKKKHQNFFFILYHIAVKGLNLRNIDIEQNGEMNLIRNISVYYKKQETKKNITIFDVGANVGNYSAVLIEEFKSLPVTLYAFEPLPVPYKKLQHLFQEKGSHYHPHNFALGNMSGEVQFYVDHDTSELGSIFQRDLSAIDIHIEKANAIKIEKTDDFCIANSISHIHFMKIDVEGAEIEVLKGAATLLSANKIDFIQFEFGAGNVDSKTYMKDFFTQFGDRYLLLRILKDGLYSMEKYNTDFEIMILGNYFAVSKTLLAQQNNELRAAFNF